MDSANNDSCVTPERRLPGRCAGLIRQLFAQSRAGQWHLSFESFQATLTRSAAKHFAGRQPDDQQVEEYFASLHVEDLALACACAEGSESAWNEFVTEYRNYLRTAAAAICRRPAADPSVTELADSLFADLYGMPDSKGGRRSLLRYFLGRSSLRTWLRAVLSQRHVDAIRAAKRFDSLDAGEHDGQSRRAPQVAKLQLPQDPHRELYLQKFREALTPALDVLEVRDHARLRLYYVEGRTLAEIGRELGEHESSVSRNLERIRKELRATVEGLLRAGKAADGGPASHGMDDAQIELCIQYAADDSAIDLERLFEVRASEARSARTIKDGAKRIVKP
jgi:RNA polymerase sigma-70 factor